MFIFILIFIVFILISLFFLKNYYKIGSKENLNLDFLGKTLINEKFFKEYKKFTLPQEKEPYVRRPDFTRINIRQGQLKLFLSELDFYLRWGGDVETVIYVGAAPGHHQRLLVSLFPKWKFILYDPRDFDKGLISQPNVELHQEFFTKESAEEIRKRFGHDVLFLSDIRTGSREEHEQTVQENMIQQKEWCELIKPKRALLKFRLPYLRNKPLTYFVGEIYLQPYCGVDSSETRLDTDCKKIKIYNNDDYNDQCFYWQMHHRPAYHEFEEKELFSIEGIDHCWDCWAFWAFFQISENYLKSKFFKNYAEEPKNPQNLLDLMKRILYNCYSNLLTPPHGLYSEEKNTYLKMKTLESITKESYKAIEEQRASKRSALMAITMKIEQKKNFRIFSSEILEYYKKLNNSDVDLSLIESQIPKKIPKLLIDKLKIKKVDYHYSCLLKEVNVDPIFSKNFEKMEPLHEIENLGIDKPGRRTSMLLLKLICAKPLINSIVIFMASAGHNLLEIIKLFPRKSFYIYSASPFVEEAQELDNLYISNELINFEELEVKHFKSLLLLMPFYFSGEKTYKTDALDICKKIIKNMNPVHYICFTFPMDLKFFEAKVLIVPWNCDRKECYIFIEGEEKEKEKDYKKLEEKFIYFNYFIRQLTHLDEKSEISKKIYEGENCIDFCWDCWCEESLWKNYLEIFEKKMNTKERIDFIVKKMNQKNNFEDKCIYHHSSKEIISNIKDLRKKIISRNSQTIYKNYVRKEARNFMIRWSSLVDGKRYFTLKDIDEKGYKFDRDL